MLCTNTYLFIGLSIAIKRFTVRMNDLSTHRVHHAKEILHIQKAIKSYRNWNCSGYKSFSSVLLGYSLISQDLVFFAIFCDDRESVARAIVREKSWQLSYLWIELTEPRYSCIDAQVAEIYWAYVKGRERARMDRNDIILTSFHLVSG